MVLGQKILRTVLRHLVWNTSILWHMDCDTFQDSAPYRRTPRTLLLKILSLVSVPILEDLQMFQSIANAPRALDSLCRTSISEFPSVVILLPRYTNSCTSSMFLLWMVSCWSDLALIFISLVSSVLMLSPTSLPIVATSLVFSVLDVLMTMSKQHIRKV